MKALQMQARPTPLTECTVDYPRRGKMLSKNLLCHLLTTTVILLCTGCSPEREAAIGLVLPLRVGIYVDDSQTCADPANAGILSFDGEGISGAHTHDCRMIIESQQGKLFAYSQRCVDTGIGDGPVTTEKGLMTIESDKRFLLQRRSGSSSFKYCEPADLPVGIPVPKRK